MHITSGSGSVLLWRRWDMLCTSAFVDDVKFAQNRPDKRNKSLLKVTQHGDSTGKGEVRYLRLPYCLREKSRF